MSNLPANTIQIPRPAPKTVSEIQVPPKAYLNFQFSLQGASSAKQGDDLVVEMPDGSKVICLGYYSNTAEGDRPQIAVNGEALPPSALDLSFFTHEVEGVRPEGQTGRPEGKENGVPGQTGQLAGQIAGQEAGQEGAQAGKQAGADAKAPASSGATATGEAAASADGGAGQQAGQGSDAASGNAASGTAASGNAASGTAGSASSSASTSSSSSSSSSAGSSGGALNDGGFKQDLNVDFLGGITRLPGLDLGSNRGFENTDIVGGPTGGTTGGSWGGSWGENGTTTAPPPVTPPFIPTDPTPPAPPLPDFSGAAAGLKEEGMHKGTVTTPGVSSATHTFSVVLPDGMDPADLRLNLTQPAPGGELAPGATINTKYGEFSYTLTPKQVPVLDADGNPVLGADGNAVLRTEVEFTLTYGNLDNDNADVNGLPEDGTLDDTLSFTVTGKGQGGGSTTLGKGDVSFTIEGSNDGPVLGKDSGGLSAHMEVKEEGVWGGNKNTAEGHWEDYDPGTRPEDADFGTHKNATTIQLDVADADKNDTHTFTLTEDPAHPGVPAVGISGTHAGKTVGMTPNADGTYTLTIDGVACGTLSFSASGAMTFTLDSTSSVIQAMKAGDASNLTFNVTVTDSGGLSDSGDVTLTIHGTNDRPVFTSADSAFTVDITETGDNVTHAKVTGKLEGLDPEGDVIADKSLNFYIKDADGNTVGTLQGQHGTLTLKPDGSYTYTENGSLRAGENKPDSFTVIVKDKNGAYSEKELTFNVEGVNNKVVFSPLDGDNYVIKLVEEGVLTGGNKPNDDTSPGDMQAKLVAEGNITKLPGGKDFIVDDDAVSGPGVANGRTFKISASASKKPDGSDNDLNLVDKGTDSQGWQTLETDYGVFKFNIYSGEYTYTLKDVGYLTKDDIKTEIFTVQVYKGGVLQGSPGQTDRDFSVTIRGMNDAPEFTASENLEVVAQGTSNTGTLSDDFTATSKDEDSGDHASHKYSIVFKQNPTDPDDPGPSAKLVQAIKGTYGVLELDPVTGKYVYNLDNDRAATKALGQNQTGEESFTIRVTDAAGAYDTITIRVTVNGAYDKPVISYAGESIAEDCIVDDREVQGDIRISTTDTVHGGTKSFTLVNADGSIPGKDASGRQTVTTEYGTLIFNTATGHYTYTLSEAGNVLLQKYNIGDIIAQKFNVRVTFPEANGKTSTVDTTIDVNLEGVNDNPYFTDASQKTVVMDRVFLWEKNPGIVQKVVAEDIDNTSYDESPAGTELTFFFKGANGEILYTIETNYGRVSINPQTGEYTYTLDPNNGSVKGLTAGNSLGDTFKVYVRDPHKGEAELDINVTINGKDIPPGGNDGYILPTDDLIVKEDGTGKGGVTEDPDNLGQVDSSHETGKIPDGQPIVRYCFKDSSGNMTQSLKGQYGDIYIDAYTGQYRYVLNNQLQSVQQMMGTDRFTEIFLVYGFTIDVNGTLHWVTNADGSLKPQGDGTGITVTIEGTNDDPVLTHTLVANGMKVYAGTPTDADIKVNGKFKADDMDVGDTKAFGLSALEPTVDKNPADLTSLTLSEGGVTYGTVTINASGEYVFTYLPGASFTGTKTLTFWVYVKDAAGAYDKEQVTITISVENTKPVIVSCTYTDESNNVIPSYAYGNADPNLNINHTTGDVTLGGSILPAGATLKGGMLESTTTLKGSFTSWDNEVVHGGQSASSFAYFLKIGGNYENLDIQDFGTLSLSRSGSFTFTLNNQSAMVKALQDGQTKVLTYKVVVRDANGAYSDEQEFTITITGTNNTPQITATQSLITMHENGDTLDSSGNVIASAPKFKLELDDADLYKSDGNGTVVDKNVQSRHDFDLDGSVTEKNGSSVDLAVTGGKQSGDGSSYIFDVQAGGVTYGKFYIKVNPNDAKDVTYWFEVDSSMESYLTKNDNVTLNFKLQFNDGFTNGLSNEAQINVNIKGDNTVPTISAADTNITLAEDGVDAQHTLTITDNDLGTNITKHDFDLTGTGTTTIGKETRSSDGTKYEFEVKHEGELYGKLHIEVNPSDTSQVKYWFEIDGSVGDKLFAGDSIGLNFDILFKDEYSAQSNKVGVTVTINGAGTPGATTLSIADDQSVVPDHDDRDASTTQAARQHDPDTAAPHAATDAAAHDPAADALAAQDVPNAAAPELAAFDVAASNAAAHDPAATADAAAAAGADLTAPEALNAPAPLLAAAATALVSDQVGALGSPDTTLPEGSMPATAPLASQGDSAGAGTESGPAQPITLETPLDHAPLPDMTSAPGQETLQFQLQTTGV